MHKSVFTTQLASLSLPFFLHFKELVGEDCGFNKSGSLYFLKQDQLPSMYEQLTLLQSGDIAHHVLDSATGRKEFPHYNWFEDDVAIFESNAGTACPYQTTEALIKTSIAFSAEALFSEEVVAINTNKDTILGVTTSSGLNFSCGHLIIAAGRWTSSLTKPLGLSLNTFDRAIQINRFCRGHFSVKLPLFVDRNLEAFGHFFADGSFAGGSLLPSDSTNAEITSSRLSISHANFAKMVISKRLNWLKNSSLEGGIRAIESYSRDGQGIISNSLGFRNLILSTGFSCTGFTLGPITGKKIASLILGQAAHPEIPTEKTVYTRGRVENTEMGLIVIQK
jgi:glycine/D-amino acid oxidase-like deaminating enzyme